MKIINYIRHKFKAMPNLPTDNLYKFGFVGSLFLIMFFIYNTVRIVENNNNKKFQLELISGEISNEAKFLSEEYSLVSEVLKSEPTKEIGDKFSLRFDSLETKLREFKNKSDNFDKNYNNFFENQDYYNIYVGAFIFLSLLSMVSSVFFGLLWYNRVQKLEDKILLIKLNKPEN